MRKHGLATNVWILLLLAMAAGAALGSSPILRCGPSGCLPPQTKDPGKRALINRPHWPRALRNAV